MTERTDVRELRERIVGTLMYHDGLTRVADGHAIARLLIPGEP